ncbi:DUF4956 domain-containing protein [Jonesia quinghaiensis]|uniref:DUF4956 domain-containing protein n=1 Tax=Jonesia quinghaiensis TaxID=262806 RepID=UPI0004093A39|nr:DUF4956 domain-containing protein [Jonesia quinghaiensis]
MNAVVVGIDLLAITLVACGLYYPRHRRKDLVVAFMVVNIGVFAVAAALGFSSVGAGLGLGLFGVLSIIRLRSEEISHSEVAYYFASLAIGLVSGLSTTPSIALITTAGLIIVALAICDHPRFLSGTRRITLKLDRAVARDEEARELVTLLLGVTPQHITITDVDFVNDTSLVHVRYRDTQPARVQQGAQR